MSVSSWNSPRRISSLNGRRILGATLIIIGIIGLVAITRVPLTSTPYVAPVPTTSPAAGSYQSAPRNIDEATELAKNYVTSLGFPDLDLKEIMEFQYNYYFIAYEKSTGKGAFEGIVEKEMGLNGMGGMMGVVHPEQGPNMMWNTKYDTMGNMMGGMMGGRQRGYSPRSGALTSEMPETDKDAVQIAQTYLSKYLPGASVEDPDTFYGYYTLHILKDGKIYGMLSVNGYTGQVWYHTWHGAFVQMKELT